MDPVTKYFEEQGLTPETAYFGNSFFEVGKTVTTDKWSITYRVEDREAIMCEFETFDKSPKGIKSLVGVFVELLRTIKQLPDIDRVRGMVQTESCFPWEDQEKKQLELLKKIYIKNGGTEEIDENGDVWLVY